MHKATAARWVRDGAGFVNSYVKDRGVRKCEFGGDIVVELDISTRVAFLLDQRGAIPNLKEPAPYVIATERKQGPVSAWMNSCLQWVADVTKTGKFVADETLPIKDNIKSHRDKVGPTPQSEPPACPAVACFPLRTYTHRARLAIAGSRKGLSQGAAWGRDNLRWATLIKGAWQQRQQQQQGGGDASTQTCDLAVLQKG